MQILRLLVVVLLSLSTTSCDRRPVGEVPQDVKENAHPETVESESSLAEKMTAAGIRVKSLFPVFGFLKLKGSENLPPGLIESDLIGYGDSYGVRKIDLPERASAGLKREITALLSQYNRISLLKIKKQERSADHRINTDRQ